MEYIVGAILCLTNQKQYWYVIGISCFSAKHELSRDESKDWFAWGQDDVTFNNNYSLTPNNAVLFYVLSRKRLCHERGLLHNDNHTVAIHVIINLETLIECFVVNC